MHCLQQELPCHNVDKEFECMALLSVRTAVCLSSPSDGGPAKRIQRRGRH